MGWGGGGGSGGPRTAASGGEEETLAMLVRIGQERQQVEAAAGN